MEDNRIQNQIAIYMTNKKLCEFTDKLKPAPIEYYPGISVAFRGEGMNDVFNEGLICLAWIEYSPEKCLLQAIVYGDGNADDYTQLIEFKNISDQDK